jgi:hypothetical protein
VEIKMIDRFSRSCRPAFRFLAVAFMLVPVGVISLLSISAGATNSRHTIVGAVRWDGWVGNLDPENPVGTDLEAVLGPNQYHYRLPFYGEEVEEQEYDSVLARAMTDPDCPFEEQGVMAQEIAFAKNAGINYWAFDWYRDSSPASCARKQYLDASQADVKWVVILFTDGNEETGGGLPDPGWLATQFDTDEYQKVLNGQPLVYVFGMPSDAYDDPPPETPNWTLQASYLNELRGVSNPDPYVVLLYGDVGTVSDYATVIGASAVSLYASNGHDGETYANLAGEEQSGWSTMDDYVDHVVPWVTSGWNNLPFHGITPPISWYNGGSDPGPDAWAQEGSAAEVAHELQDALDWNPTANEANTVLIYAWNEFAEGGWICPTKFAGTARLDAIQKVMEHAKRVAAGQQGQRLRCRRFRG